MRLAEGDKSAAVGRFDEAVSIAEDLNLFAVLQLALAWRAYASGNDDGAAAPILEEKKSQIPHHDKMEGHFVVWKSTGDKEHLAEAHRLLTFLVENAPEESRESMVENVPLHREIQEAASA
ncbi:MAG: hypothetical protein ACYTGZ_15050 [Planctomycetota bacterium]